MQPVLAAIAAFVLYFVFLRFYARFLGNRIFKLDPDAVTPAHALKDGVDYVPSRKGVLFGHHFASIAGLAPMLGPALAVIWGWLPAMLWVVFGSVLIGAVHDFSALVVSMRHRGLSIGKIAENLIGKRAKALFLLIILFLICLVMGVFIGTVADLFTSVYYPQTVFPTFFLMAVAMVIGWFVYKRSASIGTMTVAGFVLQLIAIYVALDVLGLPDISRNSWILILLAYAFSASVLPVWLLLQPRDYLNSLLLYLGLGAAYVGFFVLRPDFVAPAINTNPEGAPPIFPFVFIIIACGAASGFHGLVSSGTTSKQINKETDAVPIGYGAMIGESILGLLAVLATTAGFISAESWSEHYASWDTASGLADTMNAFINGAALFVSQLGVPMEVAQAFIALVAVSFALTTVDSGDSSASVQHWRDRRFPGCPADWQSLRRLADCRGLHRVLRLLPDQRRVGGRHPVGPVWQYQSGSRRPDVAHCFGLSSTEGLELLVYVRANGFHADRYDRRHAVQHQRVHQRRSDHTDRSRGLHLDPERLAGG